MSGPTTEYAENVVSGIAPAGPHVRAACQRHLDDLERSKTDKSIYFDPDQADHAFRFYRTVLKLNGGEFEGVPFELLPWQKFIVGSIFGWRREDGYRRFRTVYVETGKGSGKSPLAAGVGMYGLVADNEPRAEIYAAATKKDQAMILFRDAVAMVDLSKALTSKIKKSGTGANVWNLAYLKQGSFFRPISADDGASGPRPHVALLDEIHEHKTGKVVEFLRAGTKGRRQALIFMITNSGSDRTSICWEYHEYSAKVCSGAVKDDSFFAYVCALDENDDPFKDESCWDKVNPSLGVTIRRDYLEEQVREARGMPSKEATVRRLNFCEWTDAANPWISYDVWKDCADPHFDETLLYGRRCWGGLDLSNTCDLTSLALVFEPSPRDPKYRLLVYGWLPDDDLQRKSDEDKVPYISWRNQGHLLTTEGRTINKMAVLEKITEVSQKFDVQNIAYDRWRIKELMLLVESHGYSLPEMIPFGQGFKEMSPALDELERLLINVDICHNNNPVLTWNVANAAIVSDPAGNRKLSKDKSNGRIDMTVASVMAVGQMSVADTGTLDGFLSGVIAV